MKEPSPKPGSKRAAGKMRRRPEPTVRKQGWSALRIRAILGQAAKKFSHIEGAQWAGAFAFNAFFSLFPMMILFVTIASFFVDRERAVKEVISYLESSVPISSGMQGYIFDIIAGVINARGSAGAIAFLLLVWTALQCFTTLISATNRAWGVSEYNWWRLPLKSLVLPGSTAGAVLLGMAVPVLMGMAKGRLFTVSDLHYWIYALAGIFVPLLVVFLSLSLFYRFAPRRRAAKEAVGASVTRPAAAPAACAGSYRRQSPAVQKRRK
jgi:Ca2+-transporting ATPase